MSDPSQQVTNQPSPASSASTANNSLADRPGITRVRMLALVCGLVGSGVLLSALALNPTYFYRGWLLGFQIPFAIAMGALPLLCLQYLTGGPWGFALRRPFEAATRTLPLVFLMCLPIFLGMIHLYEWSDPNVLAENKLIAMKTPYLNVPFMLGRTAFWFAGCILIAWMLSYYSKAADQQRTLQVTHRAETISAPGLIFYVLAVTVYATDFVMSLEPEWFSTIFGALFGIGQVVTAWAFCVGLFVLLSDRPPLSEVAQKQTLSDFGSFLMAFIMIWAYMGLSQFLLIWSGNLPEETPWYIKRLRDGWWVVGTALILLHFFTPFALLLSTSIKRNKTTLVRVCALVLVMRVVEYCYLILPAWQNPDVVAGLIYYPAGVVGLTGLWLWHFLGQLQLEPLLASFNPNEEGAVHGAVTPH
jgi:hypothetical protein